MNHVCLMGRLTAEPELRRTQTGKDVLSFTLAIDRGYGDRKSTDFISCVAWEGTAKFISQYFRKGSLIAVEGSIQTRPYEDKNGSRRTATEVLVGHAYFTGEKSSRASADIERDDFVPPAPSFAPPAQNAAAQTSLNEYTEMPEDEDMPF